MKILVIQQKMIGDVLTTSILLESLRKRYPAAELHYLINSHTLAVVDNNPFIDKFIFVTPNIEASKIDFYKFLKTIKAEDYDITIDAYGKLSSTLISYFSKAKMRIAYYKKYTAFLLTHPIERIQTPKHHSSLALENRFRLLEPLNISFKDIQPQIYLKPDEIEGAKTLLAASGIDLEKPLFMISVLGSNATKTYPFKYMATLLNTIAHTVENAQILFNYIPSQRVQAEAIYKNCLPETKAHIFLDVYGKSLREFLAITSLCTTLIGNEGGANNMAKALSLPTFTIFSPYLNKKNWFGDNETKQHIAVHLSDYIAYDISLAKKQPREYYLKFKPNFISEKLISFLKINI
ncbi:glycosyltransferase family 9 protein [Bizionia saleffrena]|uniref:Glycosyltransferase family 9 protein n=1 Tax=Bizionia saleffrena TaxID=291189 RepID=A0A8H2LPX0_9FLAO|nr:glycosyltransferase family 9 protein [Bizionia saleffrena]TYB80246.1 glycosyltransferase family 9 protein [Bizionia saleffrena]